MDVNTFGIIIEADVDIKNYWQSLSATLNKSGYRCPEKIPIEGLVLPNSEIKIGFWIMPNNDLNGMTEDFVAFFIPDNDKLLPIASETLENIELKGLNNYLPIHKPKALIHT